MTGIAQGPLVPDRFRRRGARAATARDTGAQFFRFALALTLGWLCSTETFARPGGRQPSNAPILSYDTAPRVPAGPRARRPAYRPRLAEPPARATPCAKSDHKEVPVLDVTREVLAEWSCGAALWLDGVLGDEGDVLAARRSYGRVELSSYFSEFEGSKVRLKINARLELPAFKKRLSAFIGRDDDDEFVQGRTEGFALRSDFPRFDDRDEWLAGFGYSFPRSSRLQSDFRIGAKRLTNTKLFVQNRFGLNAFANARNLLHFRLNLFWTNEEEFGATLGMGLSHIISPALLFRWDSVGTFTEHTEGVNWRSALFLYQNLFRFRAAAYEIFVRGESLRDEPLREYGLRTIFRHPLARQRLFAEIIVGYSWPRIDPSLPREGAFGLGFGLTLPFGR